MSKRSAGRRKHVPMRTCVICRQVKPKRALTRLVCTPDAGVQVDLTGKQTGRGAYLCDAPACWEKAARTDILSRALRITLTEEDRERLRQAAPQPSIQPEARPGV
ncbi:MAG: YlxR family protein [Anaerolineae bacterium]|nr:YlxR family protein [Anaerolineae bacterium]